MSKFPPDFGARLVDALKSVVAARFIGVEYAIVVEIEDLLREIEGPTPGHIESSAFSLAHIASLRRKAEAKGYLTVTEAVESAPRAAPSTRPVLQHHDATQAWMVEPGTNTISAPPVGRNRYREPVAYCPSDTPDAATNAQRIVASVNLLADLPMDALEQIKAPADLIEALQQGQGMKP